MPASMAARTSSVAGCPSPADAGGGPGQYPTSPNAEEDGAEVAVLNAEIKETA